MEKERLEIILQNILGELYDKVFDCNPEEFIKYLRTEIGMENYEIYNFCKLGFFSKPVEEYFLKNGIESCVDFSKIQTANYLRYDDEYKLEPVTVDKDNEIINIELREIK